MKRTNYQNCMNCRFLKPWAKGEYCFLKEKYIKTPLNYVCESFEISSIMYRLYWETNRSEK